VNILNVNDAEREIAHYAARTRHEQVKCWVLTVARNYLFSGAGIAKSSFVPYEEPGPGELDIPTVEQLPLWARRDLDDGRAVHVFDLTQFSAKPFWVALRAAINWLNCIQPDDPVLNRLDRRSFETVAQKANGWMQDITANPWFHIKDKAKTYYAFSDGWRMAKLETPLQFEREGALMHHCIAGATYQRRAQDGNYVYLSLRDATNTPHATLEVDMNFGNGLPCLVQARGNSNNPLKPEYSERLRDMCELMVWGRCGSV